MNALRPKSWDEFIGQEELKRRLQVRIQAANDNYRLMDHMLLTGPPGIGKTSLASLIASQLLAQFESFIMPIPIDKLREVTLSFQGVVMLDEIHRLKPRDQEELLPVIEDGYWQRHWGREEIEQPLMIIGATTEMHKIIKPLRERFFVPPFEDYSDEQMADIITIMGKKMYIDFEPDTALALGRASIGTPRQAKHIVKCAADLADPNDTEKVLDLAGVTEDGLTVHHIKYLQTLRKSSSGIAGLKVLTSSLELPEQEVIELEPVLRRRDYIENTPRGRSLKGNGYKFLNTINTTQEVNS